MSIANPKNTVLGGPFDAGQPSYTYNVGGGGGAVGAGGVGGYGIDTITITGGAETITLDPLIYTGGSSMSSASTFSWNQDYITAANHSNVNISSSGIDMQPGTDIKIGGRSLMDAIDKMEERLGILHPNPELEDRWDQLKDLRKQYIEMEKDILEKEKIMKILKEK